MTVYTVTYRGFLQTITRTFSSRRVAECWLRRIGRRDLIPTIQEVRIAA